MGKVAKTTLKGALTRLDLSRQKAELVEVERLAEMGLSKKDVAEGMAVSLSTLKRRLADTPKFSDAYLRGRFAYKQDVAERFHKYAGKSVVGLIYETKTALGWDDGRSERIVGDLVVNVWNGVKKPARAIEEGEFKEVEG